MRVISGIAHGTNLKSPNGLQVRPTISRIKEAIFNSLMMKIENSIFLDLYSGSGAIGIEALSRGAKKSFFVDKNKKCIQIIQKNLELTKLINNAQIICDDCNFAIKMFCEKKILFDIVFMDPPYNKNLVNETLACMAKYNILSNDALIICETSSAEKLNQLNKFDFFKTKLYNNIMISYIRER